MRMIRKRRQPRIDIVPLVDVLMVLIIFFLMTMQFQNLRALNVKLPKIESAGSNLISNELVITIRNDGKSYLNGSFIEPDSLAKVFSSASQVSDSVKVLIVADEETELKHVTKVVDLCRLNGISDFRLQSR
ncbi:MAG: biopolymer transporter ExbD [Verrucomicrobiota bacterium]|nr:biopolymer transporter ExbD [Verrucomicrobiota bacterium]